MHRRGDKTFLKALMEKIRARVPNAILRTTLIVGFPGETEEDFNELMEFIKDVQFDHLGAFTYSREEDTVSYDYADQIDEKTKNARYKKLMEAQKKIAYARNKKRIGQSMTGLVVGHNKSSDTYLLRSGFNAPDDIDGKIVFSSPKPLRSGDIVTVKITGAFIYDLEGELED